MMDCGDEHCITCGDVAVELDVLWVDGSGLARCRDGSGAESDVETLLVGVVRPGERLLVHAGTALAKASS